MKFRLHAELVQKGAGHLDGPSRPENGRSSLIQRENVDLF